MRAGKIRMREKNTTAGIVLAAGLSTRFGQPKQLLALQSKALLARVLDAALESTLSRIYLVLGHERETILQALAEEIDLSRLAVVVAPDYKKGQSRSMLAGLRAAADRFDSVMFLLGDQPLVNVALIERLLGESKQSGKPICVPTYRGQQGNPTVFGAEMYRALSRVEGDRGGRSVIADYPDRVHLVELDSDDCLIDVDTPADLERLQSRLSKKT
jgi:molybdenum cofactor cytidylyltransferase